MKFYNSYWEKDWGGELTRYVKRVKHLGFDVLEVSFANSPVTPPRWARLQTPSGISARTVSIHVPAMGTTILKNRDEMPF